MEQVSLAGHGVEITLIRSTICTLAAARRAQGARQSNEAANRRGREWEAANSERPSKSEILLARIAVALLIGFAVAGILWYGLSTDELHRLWRNIAARPGGPMTFRFVLQPTMAALAAWRDGVTDARLYPRQATWEDAGPLAQTLARAFFDDPLVSFFMPNEDRRKAKLSGLFKLLFELGLQHGACDITSGCESAALWRPPNHWHIPIWNYVTNSAELLGILGLSGVVRVISGMNYIENCHPERPHYYLQAIGTDPAKQAKGFGAALIRRQLDKADESGIPCYLEATRESNILIYAHFGFELAGEIQVPGGPTIYPMWRQPRFKGHAS